MRLLVLSLFVAACGEVPLMAAHTSISTGCVTAATYAADHPSVSDAELDGFELTCHEQLETLERWEEAEKDGGPHDAR